MPGAKRKVATPCDRTPLRACVPVRVQAKNAVPTVDSTNQKKRKVPASTLFKKHYREGLQRVHPTVTKANVNNMLQRCWSDLVPARQTYFQVLAAGGTPSGTPEELVALFPQMNAGGGAFEQGTEAKALIEHEGSAPRARCIRRGAPKRDVETKAPVPPSDPARGKALEAICLFCEQAAKTVQARNEAVHLITVFVAKFGSCQVIRDLQARLGHQYFLRMLIKTLLCVWRFELELPS